MVPATNFRSGQAPCGQIVDGEIFEDRDADVLLTQEMCYSCGCVSIRHEYHDGSVARRIVDHHGHVLVDELLAAE
jgi:hypothetical protein